MFEWVEGKRPLGPLMPYAEGKVIPEIKGEHHHTLLLNGEPLAVVSLFRPSLVAQYEIGSMLLPACLPKRLRELAQVIRSDGPESFHYPFTTKTYFLVERECSKKRRFAEWLGVKPTGRYENDHEIFEVN